MTGRLHSISRDLVAGLVVSLVALPLCLGIAHASGAPLVAGLVSGVIGGLVVAWLSGSHTSVSGPAAGLTAVVLSQIEALRSFEAFLVAVSIAGLIQVGMGVLRLGFLSFFVPSNVIKGLLAAIGIILILKQIPHAVGHDADFEGDFAFIQEDDRNTFTELAAALTRIHPGAAAVGLASIALLLVWDRSRLKKSIIPAPLIVAALGVLAKLAFDRLGGGWRIGQSHLVDVPVIGSIGHLGRSLIAPDFSRITDPAIYTAAVTIAAVASLETLLNLDATDKLDPKRRESPPNRELIAQGIGNSLAGLLGGLPLTSVIVRSSVNITSGAQSRLSAFFHGVFLLVSVLFIPGVLNLVPLSALAAILVVTGLKLATPALFRQMWRAGPSQFVPFATAVVAIVLTDLLIGVLIALGVAATFILYSNYKRPFLKASERHFGGEVVRFHLADQVTFLNRAALFQELHSLPEGSQVVLDARTTDYIDPDVLEVIRDFRDRTAPAKEIKFSLIGFRPTDGIEDRYEHQEVATREIQTLLTPADILRSLRQGNDRFVRDRRLRREVIRQVGQTASGQFPIAVTLSCIDSRTSVELLFDQGIGDVFSIRIAGNVAADKVLASIEYACIVAGAKLVLVLGHTACGAVGAACEAAAGRPPLNVDQCPHLPAIVSRLGRAIDAESEETGTPKEYDPSFVDRVARRNVEFTLDFIREQCPSLVARFHDGSVSLVGGLYDVRTGHVNFFGNDALIIASEKAEVETATA